MTTERASQRVLVTGATGFIGTALVHALSERGDQVVVLTRSAEAASHLGAAASRVVVGDPAYDMNWSECLAGCTGVINLAGAPMDGRRWNARYRQTIADSRIEGTHNLVQAIAALPVESRPRVLISGSGIDYYPTDVDLGAFTSMDDDDDVDESAPSGEGFLPEVCRGWEAEANAASKLGVRVVVMRIGLVLGPGRVLDRLALPFRLRVGGRLGSGRQWVCWIHLRDVVAAMLFALDTGSLAGPVNLVAPTPVRSGQLASAVGAALGRSSWLPVPGFALRLVLGELAEYLLGGRRAVPAALSSAGFEFGYPTVDDALKNLLGRG